jgi:hypothetical protein
MRFWELGAGFLAYVATGSGFRCCRLQHRLVAWLAAIGLVSVLFAPIEFEREATVLAVTCTALLIWALKPGIPLQRTLGWTPIVSLGVISYSLYLWHWSVLSISRWTIGVSAWTAPVQLALIIALAAFSYAYVERPLRRRTWSLSPLRTVAFGLGLSAVAYLTLAILSKPLRGMLYTGQPAALAQKGVRTLASERRTRGMLLWPARECIFTKKEDVGKVLDPERCVLGGQRAPSDRLFLVVGNSFSAAEVELVDVLRQEKLGAVLVTSALGGSPVAEIPNQSPWAAANAYYWNSVVPALLKKLRNGDFLIVISDVSSFTPLRRGPDEEGLRLLASGITRLAKELGGKGVTVIFQTAIPYMSDAKCSPDMAQKQWFHISEPPICTYFSREETIERRKPLATVLSTLERTHPNFHVLDLLPVLCPGTACRMRDERGVFLYRDMASHLSMEANHLAQPILAELVERITSKSWTIVAPSASGQAETLDSTP